MQNILIIDDDRADLEALSEVLTSKVYYISTSQSGKEALKILQQKEFDVVLTDLIMPDVDGMEILRTAKGIDPAAQVILITGLGSIDKAVEAMKEGAADFIEKPVRSIAELREKVRKAIEEQNLQRQNMMLQDQNISLRMQLDEKFGFANIIGNSKKMHEVFTQLKLVSPTKANVMICGETGTGKELIARAIHNNSPRKDKSFIAINCAAITKDLLESELFGHEKGAFTGADRQRKGAFELADGGTLLLDEVSEMGIETQAKFLRVLEDPAFRRVGGEIPTKVDVRIISSTNRDLSAEVENGNFREDLYYRLKVVTINIPPLRERKDDIPVLVNAFLQEFSKENNRSATQIEREALDRLISYDWPGNIRELRNCIESMVVMSTTEKISVADLPPNIRGLQPSISQSNTQNGMSMEDIEKETIRKALEAADGNRTKAAETLKIGLRTLYRKMDKYGLSVERGD